MGGGGHLLEVDSLDDPLMYHFMVYTYFVSTRFKRLLTKERLCEWLTLSLVKLSLRIKMASI